MTTSEKKPRTYNWVAKHAQRFQKSAVMTDKKKACKRGARKHKGQWPALMVA